MTFRFPFQIYRCVSAAKHSFQENSRKCKNRLSTNKIFLSRGYSSIQKRTTKLPTNPTNLLLFFRNYAWKQTDPSNRALVRQQNKCDEKVPKTKKLEFRQTTKEDCMECGHEPADMYAPKMKRLKQRYDPAKMIWKHEGCDVFRCEDMPRADGVIKTEQKKLKKMKFGNCELCSDLVMVDSPGFKRLKPSYDASKMKWTHVCPAPDECDLEPPRMDDVYCWAPTKKTLPPYNKKDKHICP